MIEAFEQMFPYFHFDNKEENLSREHSSDNSSDNFQFFHDWMNEERECRFCQPVIDAAIKMRQHDKTVTCSHCGTSYQYNILMKFWERSNDDV